jgi:hypothetical protein
MRTMTCILGILGALSCASDKKGTMPSEGVAKPAAANPSSDPSTPVAPTPAAADPAPVPPPPPPPPQPSRAAAMKPGFQKAFTSFQEYAAAQLGVIVDQVQAGPDGEDVKMEQTLGKAWAYTAIQKDISAPRQIRGWGTADGTVVTPQQNLGALLREAGVWSKKARKAQDIAAAITWAMGTDYSINLDPWPEIKLDKKGAGTFIFAVDSRQSGPGGAGGGPTTKQLVTVTLSADHSATMAMAPI